MSLNTKALENACTIARGLAMDAVAAANSGHLGLPLGTAELGAVLFGHSLRYHPAHPDWINRDRFVLSAGHGSMFLYSWLHLAGYDLPLKEVEHFRQLHSKTPGHPEFRETPGVECTTGPLGQGVGNAVGMASAAKMAAAHFNTQEHQIFDHKVVCLAGDGCLQEGVSAEASAFAGRHGLDNLILFYDSNDVTLDAAAEKSQCEDTAERYKAYGFDVQIVEKGNDMGAILKAYENARNPGSGKPQMIILKTLIGKGIEEVAGSYKAHGEAGVKYVEQARRALKLPEQRFYVSDEVKAYFEEHQKTLEKNYEYWMETFEAWKQANPDKAALLQKGLTHEVPAPSELLGAIPSFKDEPIATRAAAGKALQPVSKEVPLLISGSADLHGSTKNYITEGKDFDVDTPQGRNIYWGIREHGMGAIMNGFAYYGIFRASGATFLTFSDYLRPSIRLAALSRLPVFYFFTHDSIGVGEDGPTHQPVETTSALRLIPHLDVIRPGDAEETAGALVAALERNDGPTALILSRQNLPVLSEVPEKTRRAGVLSGGYVVHEESEELDIIIMATGSELQHAVAVAKELGNGVRVVSMPCTERFDRQPQEYKDKVLPPECKKRVAIEAGVSDIWHKYVGSDGKVVGVDDFGLSAPGNTVMKERGITAEHLMEVVRPMVSKTSVM